MALLVTVVIVMATMAFVAYPIIKSKPQYEETQDDTLDELLSQQDAAYTAIKELDFDYQTGSLSLEDVRQLEERYKQKAVSVLKQIDAYEEGSPAEKATAKPVSKPAQASAKERPPQEDEIEKQVLKLRQPGGKAASFCARCGARLGATDRFCSRCGAPLKRRAR